MQLDQNSFFKNRITPWYDSNPVCWIFIILGVISFLFGLSGIMTAVNNFLYINFVWVPSLISILSLFIIIKISIRLIKRKKDAQAD